MTMRTKANAISASAFVNGPRVSISVPVFGFPVFMI